jgi:hypothetical protein
MATGDETAAAAAAAAAAALLGAGEPTSPTKLEATEDRFPAPVLPPPIETPPLAPPPLTPLDADPPGPKLATAFLPWANPTISLIHSCLIASKGDIRLSGSHSKHLSTKSKNTASPHLNTLARFLVLGLRLLPLEFTNGLGCPLDSKNNFDRDPRAIKDG